MSLAHLVPWRVRALVSNRFPLLYHLSVNAGFDGNSASARTGGDEGRNWPTKNTLVRELTSPRDRIFDLACGNGSILRHLQGTGERHLHGLEISGPIGTRTLHHLQRGLPETFSGSLLPPRAGPGHARRQPSQPGAVRALRATRVRALIHG